MDGSDGIAVQLLLLPTCRVDIEAAAAGAATMQATQRRVSSVFWISCVRENFAEGKVHLHPLQSASVPALTLWLCPLCKDVAAAVVCSAISTAATQSRQDLWLRERWRLENAAVGKRRPQGWQRSVAVDMERTRGRSGGRCGGGALFHPAASPHTGAVTTANEQKQRESTRVLFPPLPFKCPYEIGREAPASGTSHL
jgi:hypothetical protein